jgi:xanthine dehydrogenase/oxidase
MPTQSEHDPGARQLIFSLNGRPIRVSDPDPKMLLIEFLRSKQIGLTGTKLSCGEGGCGACAVVLSRLDPHTRKAHHMAVNSCLRPLCSLDGMLVTTIEGLGNTRTGLDRIQARIAEMNGSQCGFCTPGMVMNAFSLLQSVPAPSQQAVEDHLDGHICRCTGYRPILQALRTFAVDRNDSESNRSSFECKPTADAPELSKKHPQFHHGLFTRATSGHHDNPHGYRQNVETVDHKLRAPSIRFPEALYKRALSVPRLEFRRNGSLWLRPNSLDEVLEIKNSFAGQDLKLVVGNTSAGIYKNQPAEILVDISGVPDLLNLIVTEDGMHIGAAVSLQEIITFTARSDALLTDPLNTSGFRAFGTHLQNVANLEVRSVASIGGNIAMTRANENTDDPFPSDVDTILTALGAHVTVASKKYTDNTRTFGIEELPSPRSLPSDAVIVSFSVPLTGAGEHVQTYKVASRQQNAHAIVNAGFRVRIDSERVTNSTIALGGIDRRTFRATKSENLLIGQPWNDKTLEKALRVLGDEIKQHLFPFADSLLLPDEYRISLGKQLFYKFFVSVANKIAPSTVSDVVRSAGVKQIRPLSRGEQEFRVDTQERPVGEPLINRNAYLQASGEALYTQDVPLPNRGLNGAVVLSRNARARFSFPGGLKPFLKKLQVKFPFVKSFVTSVDVPGQNVQGLGGDECIFASDEVSYYGQLIGIVLAVKANEAAMAARWIEGQIKYSGIQGQKAVFEIEDALNEPDGQGVFKNNKFITVIPELVRAGSDENWLVNPTTPIGGGKIVRGTQRCAGQAHFYMETQTCIAIPDERRTIQLHTSTQSPATDQSMVAMAIGIPVAQVQAEVRRIGGGFGGKQFRSGFISAATAVAAWVVSLPVRVSLTRNEDMALVGKRHPFLGEYAVSVNDEGLIQAMRLDLVSNGGCSLDCSFPVMNLAQQHADCCYFVPTFKTTGKVARTNNASNTAMRTFGVVQTTLIVEEALERTAHELQLSPEDLRKKNFYETSSKDRFQRTHYGQALKYCNLTEVWDALIRKSQFNDREKTVRQFNREHRWRKRGISVVPLKFGMGFQPRMMDQATALVNIYATDGSVLLQHGGVEMGQGLHTKMLQIAAESLGIPMEWIVMGDTWTGSIPNAIATAASTASDLNGGAIRKACTDIRRRLEQFCIDKEIKGWRDNWQQLWPMIVAKAYQERINLNSQAHYKVPFIGDIEFPHQYGRAFHYFTYSASCSEVEIDVLTGETTIVRADILYDAGNSLNPCIDIGQLEGGFVQGCGLMLTEDLIYRKDGSLLSNGTWNYKPPCSKSIPVDFRVGLHYGSRHDPVTGEALDFAAVLGSKGIGEPGLVLSTSVFFAVKHAIHAARSDMGLSDWFEMPAPATVSRVQQYCSTRDSSLRLNSASR